MFACLYSLSVPTAALVKLAEDFTPRFAVTGPLVMLDVSGLSRLFGSPQEIADALRRSANGPVRIALASSQTAAALLALGRAGVTVVAPGDERATLMPLPVSLLADLDRLRLVLPGDPRDPPGPLPALATPKSPQPPHIGEMGDALPYVEWSLERTSSLVKHAHCGGCGGGWRHPRDSHAASMSRRTRRAVTASAATEHPSASARPTNAGELRPGGGGHPALKEIQMLVEVLCRWGIKTFGALAALPPADVYERLGAGGVRWQRLAQGENASPLVPWVPEDPFEATLDLEWPIEGLEPLSFVLGRLLEPLAERLERADRGAAVLHTYLTLVSKEAHARTLQLPAPMRDPKTLRTLVWLDLEANPPAAAIDKVRLLIEPTPARVTQWMLFERAQPAPEQVSTLLARLSALMGEAHVGSPRLVDSWKPGVFAMERFEVTKRVEGAEGSEGAEGIRATALRRFRLPVPVRVQMHDGRPVRMMTDRRGVAGGAIVQAAGPWRTSGEWWNDAATRSSERSHSTCWDRDEWDGAMADGTVYRLYVERDVGQWFLEGIVD